MAIDRKRGGRGSGGEAGDDGRGERQAKGELLTSSDVRTGLIPLRTKGLTPVQYSVVDGLAIFEGDIVLGTVEEVERRTMMSREALPEAVAITGDRFRWANCRIPYTIDPALTNQARVTDAIAHWEASTNYRFVVRTTEPDWVTFRPGGGCSSHVGRQGGQQFVNLADGCLRGQVIHEIGHVVGLWHEQSREDRDLFVQIRWENIEPAAVHNFNQHIADGDDIGAYDYGSIMHYGRTAFSRNGQDTIVPINPAGAQIGQRTALSAGDVAAANSLCTGGGGGVTIKETIKDVLKDGTLDTRKELIKDIRLDTRKEIIHDTRKELIHDKRWDPIDPFGPRKLDPIQPGVIRPGTLRPVIGGAGNALPFVMATKHQAPGAETGGGAGGAAAEQVMQLDAQLQAIADALAQAQSNVDGLQQQYDETMALLNAAMADYDQGTR